MSGTISITTTDRLGREWSIVSHTTVVGFEYSVALEHVETDKGWTDIDHTAENVQRLLRQMIGLRFKDGEVTS